MTRAQKGVLIALAVVLILAAGIGGTLLGLRGSDGDSGATGRDEPIAGSSSSPSTTPSTTASTAPTTTPAPGATVPPMNHLSSAGGTKLTVASWSRRSHRPTWTSIVSLCAHAGHGVRLPTVSPGR